MTLAAVVENLRARLWIALLAGGLAVLGAHLLPTLAAAHGIYVTNRESDSVSVIDSRTNAPVGSPIELGAGAQPTMIAISPDGGRAYVAGRGTNAVFVIDTRTNRVVAPPIGIAELGEIAISPDGKAAYALEEGSAGGISRIDTATNQVSGPPIEVEGTPRDLAVTPDGRSIYVVNDREAVVVDVSTGQAVKSINVGAALDSIAISPDGARAYVTDFLSGEVVVIDTRTNEVLGARIPVGGLPTFLAMSPNGRTVYVSSQASESVSAIDIALNQVVATIPVAGVPVGIAVSPDGKTAYVPIQGTNTVAAIDTRTNQLGEPIQLGAESDDLAIVPNQAPVSAFSARDARIRPGVPTSFDAGASRDPDGAIAGFSWSVAGRPPFAAGSSLSHTFARPGTFDVTLTLTDDEGCSTTQIFTGQTAHCNGSGVATQTVAVKVAYPGVRIRCPAKAKPRRCRFALQVVTKARKGKAKSQIAKASAKAGKAAIVSLRPKRRYAKSLAGAKRVLVKQTLRVGKTQRTTYRKLKIVR